MPGRAPRLAAALLLAGLATLTVGACRPDPYALFLRTIEPGEEVALPDGMTLVAGAREGAVLRDVTITGPARTCEGTMEIEAEEVRVERATEGATLVILEATAEERCGTLTSTTRNDRLTIRLGSLLD
jgi:hypothetical protein